MTHMRLRALERTNVRDFKTDVCATAATHYLTYRKKLSTLNNNARRPYRGEGSRPIPTIALVKENRSPMPPSGPSQVPALESLK